MRIQVNSKSGLQTSAYQRGALGKLDRIHYSIADTQQRTSFALASKTTANPGTCQVKHTISLAAFLYILWFGLSGHSEPLLLSLGIASVVFTVYLAHRMDVIDHESHPIHHLFGLLRFWPYLTVQVIKSNIDVIGRILRPGRSISPQMVDLPLPQRSDLGRVIYANSITLTPGTVSVHLGKDTIMVHALSKQGADELGRGEMASRVPDDMEDISRVDRDQ